VLHMNIQMKAPPLIVAVIGHSAGKWAELCEDELCHAARSASGLEGACSSSGHVADMLLGFCVVKSWEVCFDAACVKIAAMHRLLRSRWAGAAGYVHYPVLGSAYLDPPVPCPGASGKQERGASFMDNIYAAVGDVMVHHAGQEPMTLKALVEHWRSCFSCAPVMCGFRVWGAFGELALGLTFTSSWG
jgi:hypothetical protein